MSMFKHFDSLEFGIAEKIWDSAHDKATKIKAINYYKMAAAKKDARALLALYKINSEWISSYLITGRQHNSLPYLFDALKLGYLPAFIQAGRLDIFSVYARLIYLSTGMEIARHKNDPKIIELQESFIELSEDFAIELIPDIIQRGQGWSLGELPNTFESHLERQLVEHPCRYDPKNDKVRENWTIFQAQSIEQYLKQLPGSQEYFLAYELYDEGDSNSKETYLSLAASKGNGQALYALGSDTRDLINAAKNGSPDAFEDLMYAILIDISQDVGFKNFSESSPTFTPDFIARVDCLLYLYSLMERLGIERFAYGIEVLCLTSESKTGYAVYEASMHQLKYQLCEHEQIVEIHERAGIWHLGKNFDSKFHQLFNAIRNDED